MPFQYDTKDRSGLQLEEMILPLCSIKVITCCYILVFIMFKIIRETGAPYKYVKVERPLYHLHYGLLTFLISRLSRRIQSSCKTSSMPHQETTLSQSGPMQRYSCTTVRKGRPWATFRTALTPVLL